MQNNPLPSISRMIETLSRIQHKLKVTPQLVEDIGDRVRVLGIKHDMLDAKFTPAIVDGQKKLYLHVPEYYVDCTYKWDDGRMTLLEENLFEIYPRGCKEQLLHLATLGFYARLPSVRDRACQTAEFKQRCVQARKAGAYKANEGF